MAVVCQKICIVIGAIFGVIAGLVVLIIGIVAQIAYKATNFTLSGFRYSAGFTQAMSTSYIIIIVLIAFGAVVIMTNLLGCCGALCSSLCMTYIFFVFQIVLTCVSITIAILVFVGQEKISDTFRNELNCEVCDTLLTLTGYAFPIGGLFIFAALCQALTVYCAWVVAQKIKDGSLRKGRVVYQPGMTTVVVATTR